MSTAWSASNTAWTRIAYRLFPALAAFCLCPGLAQAQMVSPTSIDVPVSEGDPDASVEITLSTGCGGFSDVGLDWSISVDS